jgi:hypothetical protein
VTKVVGDYGLGLQLHENNGEKWFSHGGAGQGYMSTMVAYPKGGRGAIIMTNGEEGGGLALEIIGCRRRPGPGNHRLYRPGVRLDREFAVKFRQRPSDKFQ